jgi:hypothetical protein
MDKAGLLFEDLIEEDHLYQRESTYGKKVWVRGYPRKAASFFN